MESDEQSFAIRPTKVIPLSQILVEQFPLRQPILQPKDTIGARALFIHRPLGIYR